MNLINNFTVDNEKNNYTKMIHQISEVMGFKVMEHR